MFCLKKSDLLFVTTRKRGTGGVEGEEGRGNRGGFPLSLPREGNVGGWGSRGSGLWVSGLGIEIFAIDELLSLFKPSQEGDELQDRG